MNEPLPQVVNKTTRMTANKRAVLQCLADLGVDFLEWGTPPYAVSLLAEEMGTDLSNLTKTMKALERDGLVVREMAKVVRTSPHTAPLCLLLAGRDYGTGQGARTGMEVRRCRAGRTRL